MISTFTFPTVNEILNVWTKKQKIDFFENTLKSCLNHEGVDNVINFLHNTDFYEAPSSAAYHSNYECGLLDHSILVYVLAMKFRDELVALKPELAEKLPEESIKISALLHDLCKTNFYKKTVKYKKDASTNNQWVAYTGYVIDDTFPIGHGEKSVIMLQNIGLRLSIEEMLAIRYHMGAWDGALLTNDVKYAYNKALDECPLIVLLQNADNTSSLIFENKTN